MSITMKQVFHFAQNQLGVYIQKVGKRIFTDSYSYTVTVDAAQVTFSRKKA
jgi:hypothetical protein